DLLKVLVRRVPAEHGRLRVLVPSPIARQHSRRVVVVALGGALLRAGPESALLGALLRGGHARDLPEDPAVPGHDVDPVDAVRLALDPHPVLGERILVPLELRAVGPHDCPPCHAFAPSGIVLYAAPKAGRLTSVTHCVPGP